ncbi:methyl-accepting chemotaxis protein [Methylomagnum sp.]
MATQQRQVSASLFSRLLLWQKFAILGVVAAMLVAVPFYYFFKAEQESINASVLERDGLAPVKELLALVQVLPRHRGSSTGLLNGNEALAGEEKTTRDLADQHIAAFSAMAASIQDEDLRKLWLDVQKSWPQISQAVVSRSVAAPKNFDAHTQLITQMLDALDRVVDYYGLSLDPAAESYFLIQAILSDGPSLTEYLGQARGWGTGLLAKAAKQGTGPAASANAVTLQDRTKLGTMTNLARDRLTALQRDLEKAGVASPQLKASLDALTASAIGMGDKVLDLSQTEIIGADNPNFSSTDYYTQYTQAINEAFKLLDAGSLSLDELLAQRVASARQAQITISGVILAVFLVGALIAFYISRSITNPIGHLVGVMDKLASGDSTVRAHLESFDEIGALGRQFDMMVDQREAVSAKIQRENDALNNSIIELLQAVAQLAQRDLTVRVPVAEDVTGPVADALNLLSGETAKVLNRVTDIARSVANVSQLVKTQSDTVIQVATEDKREVEQATAELSRASEVMQEIARLASACNEAAEKAIKNTERAQDTVLGTVQGITAIRDTIRETEKRIKRLGERSQEIGGVVSLINSIAERTHILALNASMHAASAGEAGRGFAVVANEVQRLAENAREATSKIAGLVSNIQVETADTVNTMNEAISQVVRGTDLAQKAGGEMRETRDTTADLVQLVQRIAASSTSQAQMTQQLRERAVQIQKNTERTYDELQEQGLQTERLVDFSTGLVESVGVFVLPKAAAA